MRSARRRTKTTSSYEAIDKHQLRKAIAESQVQHQCTEEMGVLLMRIHDIVIKTSSYFTQTIREEEEEGRSYSLERWLKRGLWLIDLSKRDNPFSYLFAGTYLNIVNKIMTMRKKQIQRERLQKMLMDQLLEQMPSLQAKDLTTLNDL